jgi:starch phosphorylase
VPSSRAVVAGRDDLDRAAAGLAARLPEPLAVLSRLAYNYRWSWTPGGPELFASVDPQRWRRCAENPVRLLQEARPEAIEQAAGDAELLERAAGIEAVVQADLARESTGPTAPDGQIAYFSAEFGVHGSLPIYSGGLGALAGDILKEASDRALPMVAVALLYRQGYFRQRIDGTGWQHEYWVDTDPERVPAALIRGPDGQPVTITVPIWGRDVVAQIWRVDVGRVPLLLLDAERPENHRVDRWITSRLYVPDPSLRLAQYMLLGIGGVRALRALDVDPEIVHLNEGHAAFVSLEMACREASAGASLDPALETARRHTVFTTHTPVPAGNDTYPPEQVAALLAPIAHDLGVEPDELVRLGRTTPDEPHEPFGVTQFALRTSRAANAVSRRHGEVARSMWQGMWPDRSEDDVPITYVTNGAHLPSWIGGPLRSLLDRYLGDGWMGRASDPATWAPLDDVPDAELWAARNAQRATLVDYIRDRSTFDRLGRDEPLDYVEAAAGAWDPDVLTLGFARRLATYKRLHLLVADVARSQRLLLGDRRLQLVIAGKAHPRDDDGKRLVQGLFAHKREPGFGASVVYLDDYDLRSAAVLVRGCDVWVNLPRPPLEASGTSGMKSAFNGGLNLSVLDGWWAEGYDGTNGWAIDGAVDQDQGAQDARHSGEVLRLLEEEVVPTFYDGRADGVPTAWVARVRAALKTCGPAFAAGRMLADYEQRVYAPSLPAIA